MLASKRFRSRECLAAITFAITLIVPICSNFSIDSSIIKIKNCSYLTVSSVLGIVISSHCIIEYTLDYMTKSVLLPKEYMFSRYPLIVGSLASDIALMITMLGINSFHDSCLFVLLQTQSILVLLSLNSYLENFLQEAKWTLSLVKSAYFLSISLLLVSTISCAIMTPNKLPVDILLILFSFLSVLCLMGALYSWYKYYQTVALSPTVGLNLKASDTKYFLAAVASLYALYSIGIIFYSLSLHFREILCAQKMVVMMHYLNNFCVYFTFLQDGVVSRLLLRRLQVRKYCVSPY